MMSIIIKRAMKLSAQQVAENRERVIDTALKLFRERGFDGVSVSDLMRSAGLTHGGFYNHFASKADLAAQACARAFAGSTAVLREAAAAPSGPGRKFGLAGYISRYLSRSWRDAPAAHCPMVAFGTDVARGDESVSAAYGAGVEAYIAGLAALTEGDNVDPASARRQAITLAATLTGALALSRAVRASHPALSDEILATVRDALLSATLDASEEN